MTKEYPVGNVYILLKHFSCRNLRKIGRYNIYGSWTSVPIWELDLDNLIQ